LEEPRLKMGQRSRAPRNRTVNLSPEETSRLLERVVTLGPKDVVEAPTDGIILGTATMGGSIARTFR